MYIIKIKHDNMMKNKQSTDNIIAFRYILKLFQLKLPYIIKAFYKVQLLQSSNCTNCG